MQAHYAEQFERDMACTAADWLRWLPLALGEHAYTLHEHSASVRIGAGALALRWQVAPPRTIGLVRLPRLLVQFHFTGLGAAQRHAFMQRFDLYMQRGGG